MRKYFIQSKIECDSHNALRSPGAGAVKKLHAYAQLGTQIWAQIAKRFQQTLLLSWTIIVFPTYLAYIQILYSSKSSIIWE